jgi:NADH:ubiquinone oxidoreductase subunit E
MAIETKKIEPPSSDKRWRMVDTTMRKHGYRSDALIESLHTMQECFGFLEEPGLKYIAQSLRLPLSKVYGVATFYHFFTLKPKGRHTCVVCMGTACYIKGAQNMLDAIQHEYGTSSRAKRRRRRAVRADRALHRRPAAWRRRRCWTATIMGRLIRPMRPGPHIKGWMGT